MVKINLTKAFGAYNIFLEISGNKVSPFKISYWCMKNLKALENDAKFYIDSRNNLFDQYLEKDEEGKLLTHTEDGNIKGQIKEGCIEEFTQKMNELNNHECEVQPYKLDLDYLMSQENFSISAKDLIYLEDFIEE